MSIECKFIGVYRSPVVEFIESESEEEGEIRVESGVGVGSEILHWYNLGQSTYVDTRGLKISRTKDQ